MITDKGRRVVRKMREGLASSLSKMLVDMDEEARETLPRTAGRVAELASI